MKLAEIAQKLGCRLEGPPEIEIRGVAGIEHAEAGQITFLANRRYFPLLKTTRASAVLIEEGIALDRDATMPALAALRSANPYLAFAHALELFYQPPRYAPGIHPTAIIGKSAKIDEGAHVGPYCYVDEEVEIGRHATLHSFVTVYRGAKIGDDFFAHAHAVDIQVPALITEGSGIDVGQHLSIKRGKLAYASQRGIIDAVGIKRHLHAGRAFAVR